MIDTFEVESRLRATFEAVAASTPTQSDLLPADPDVIRPTPRRPGSRGVLVAAASIGVIVVIATAVLVVLRHNAGQPDKVSTTRTTASTNNTTSRIDAALLWSDGHGVVRGDPNTGRSKRVSREPFEPIFATRDGVLVGQVSGQVALLFANGTTRVIGIGAPFPGTDGHSFYVATTPRSLEQLDGNGSVLGGPWQVPKGYELSGQTFGVAGRAVVDGILVQTTENNSDHSLAIWNPHTKTLRYIGRNRWDVIDTYTAPGASTSLIAWIRAGCKTPGCDISLTDSASAITLLVAAPAAHYGYFYGGAFSPDGSRLAVFASRVAEPDNPAVDLAIIDTANGHVTLVPQSRLTVGEPQAVARWSPTGKWVLFSNFGDPLAYRVGADRATPLAFHFSSPTSFIAVAAQTPN
jgi:hypothetical protein